MLTEFKTHRQLTYHREYHCFAYAPAFAENYGYIMDDFGTAVIPSDMYGLEDSYWTED